MSKSKFILSVYTTKEKFPNPSKLVEIIQEKHYLIEPFVRLYAQTFNDQTRLRVLRDFNEHRDIESHIRGAIIHTELGGIERDVIPLFNKQYVAE